MRLTDKKRISFVSTNKSIDVKKWSGTEYYVAKTLEKHFDINYILNIKTTLFTKATLKKIIYKKDGGYSITRSPEVTKNYARQVEKQLSATTDIIFSISSIPIAYVETDKPKVFYTDATFAQMLNYYEEASSLCPQTIKEGMALEKQALDSASLVFYSSDWAANSAINDYGVSPDKIKVIPFGANIENILETEDIKSLIENKDTKICKILFLGIDWYRKRGDLVLEAVRILNEEMGIQTELHIVGIKDLPITNLPSYVYNHGFISKAEKGGIEKIEKLITDSHFLFVPSKMEAYGLVFCESMSFGVPPVTTRTGGIPTIVKNQENGLILGIEATPYDYAKNIYDVFTNQSVYKELCLNAFNDFKNRLNWNIAGKTMASYINKL